MGDEMDAPHDAEIEVADWLVRTVTYTFIKGHYLAGISGGLASWILRTDDDNGTPIAVIAQQWQDPKFVISETCSLLGLVPDCGLPRAYVQYHCQVDPDSVFAALQNGESFPDRNGR